jgi:hypothetical protein
MNELKPPPLAASPEAKEVLRVWAAHGSPQQFTLQPTWDDPAAWGLLLSDLARHVAKAYAAQGLSEAEAFERIVAGLQAELSNPTDLP